MLACELCKATFDNNLGGQLTNHVKKTHNLSLEDYIVKTRYSGYAPRCQCGLCDERPVFYRGEFKNYAAFHKRFDVREKLWRAKFGEPKCKNCGGEVRFLRGLPNDFCTASCKGKFSGGFNRPEVQEKIRETVIARYGVDHISKVDSVRQKISKSRIGKHNFHCSDLTKTKMSEASRKKWSNPEYKQRTSHSIRTSLQSPEIRQKRSQQMIQRMSDPIFRESAFKNSKNRLTKMHQKLRTKLKLDDLGFVSEQRIGRYFVDELNESTKTIIEFFGDHPHANPKKYKPDDVIRLRGQSYIASQKWQRDQARKEDLEAMGYRVIVIWESDDLTSVVL